MLSCGQAAEKNLGKKWMFSRIFRSENSLMEWYCRTSIAWSKPEEFNLAKTEDETDKPLTEQIPANIDSNSIARRVGGNAVKQILWRILHNIQQLCKDWDDLYIKRETRSEKTLLLLFYLLIVLSPFIFISAEGCPYQPPARISIALCQEH